MQPLPSVFFYGTFMNRAVLIDHGVTPTSLVPAKLKAFELYVRPRVNLMHSDRSCVYSAIAAITQQELSRVYSHLDEVFGVKYSPQAVLAETLDGEFQAGPRSTRRAGVTRRLVNRAI